MTRSYLALVLFAAACGTTSDAAPAPASSGKAQRADTGATPTLCIEVFTKNRTCTDDYIPALVDIRAKYDVPAGIAEEVKKDRAGVIAMAKTEWATDSADAAIAATCEKLIATWHGDQSDVDEARACLTKPDCASYTACIMPQFEKRFTK